MYLQHCTNLYLQKCPQNGSLRKVQHVNVNMSNNRVLYETYIQEASEVPDWHTEATRRPKRMK
jgi:hypothetical protein